MCSVDDRPGETERVVTKFGELKTTSGVKTIRGLKGVSSLLVLSSSSQGSTRGSRLNLSYIPLPFENDV